MKLSCFIFCVCIIIFKADASIINRELLDHNSSGIVFCIQSNAVIDQERINDNLDFITHIPRRLDYDSSLFSTFIAENVNVIEQSKHALRHNRFGKFVKACQVLYDQQEADLIKKYTLYTLLTCVLEKHRHYLHTLQQRQLNPTCRLSDESHRTDSTEASSLDESDEDYDTCDRNISVLLKSDDKGLPFEKLSVVDLESKSFMEGSFTYFRKKLSTAKHPVRVTSDLKTIRIAQLNDLSQAVRAIDISSELVEIILMNGSSRKFNILFPLLEEIYNTHIETGKSITIVYHTTSESQSAYKRLYTLRGVNVLTHAHLDDIIIGLDTSLTSVIRSSEKVDTLSVPQVIKIKEEDDQDVEKIERVVHALKDVKRPLILQDVRQGLAIGTDKQGLSSTCHLFNRLTVEE